MSTRKASLTDKQTKNGTSKYVLERCASINEYYDIAFKVCISVLCVDFFLLLVEQVSTFTGGWTGTTGCTCSSSSNNMISGSSHVLTPNLGEKRQASCILPVKQSVLSVCIKVVLSAHTDANICRGCTCCSLQTLPLNIYKSSLCATGAADEDAQTGGKVWSLIV